MFATIQTCAPHAHPIASDVSQIEFPRTDSPLSSEPSSPPKSSPMPIAQPEMKSSHTEQAEAAKSASPSSTSWFSSFGRAKGKKLAPVPALEDTTRSEPSPILEESEPPSAVNLFHPQTGPLAVPSIDNAPFVGANQLAPLQEYHALQRTQTALSIPSSLDTVTRVESTESSPIPTSPIAEGHRGLMRTPSSDATLRTRMDSLNPSTGRFNLGILFPFGGSNNSVSKVDADRRDAGTFCSRCHVLFTYHMIDQLDRSKQPTLAVLELTAQSLKKMLPPPLTKLITRTIGLLSMLLL